MPIFQVKCRYCGVRPGKYFKDKEVVEYHMFSVNEPEKLVIPGRGRSPRARNPYVDGPRLARGAAKNGFGRLLSYVRPLCAARMAAGPDGFRGSDPEHEHDV